MGTSFIAGQTAGLQVIAGSLSAEAAGDLWVSHADRSHTAGQDFLRGYESTGAPR